MPHRLQVPVGGRPAGGGGGSGRWNRQQRLAVLVAGRGGGREMQGATAATLVGQAGGGLQASTHQKAVGANLQGAYSTLFWRWSYIAVLCTKQLPLPMFCTGRAQLCFNRRLTTDLTPQQAPAGGSWGSCGSCRQAGSSITTSSSSTARGGCACCAPGACRPRSTRPSPSW